MKWLLIAAFCLCLAGVMVAEREALSNDDCYPCWDAFIYCDDQSCCKDVKKKDCRKCDDIESAYNECMRRFEPRPQNKGLDYLRYRFNKVVEDELDKY